MNQQVIFSEGKKTKDRRVQRVISRNGHEVKAKDRRVQVTQRAGHKVKAKDRRVLSSHVGFVGWLMMTVVAWSWALNRGGQAAWFVASALGFLLLYAMIVRLTAFDKPRVVRKIAQGQLVAGDTLRVMLEIEGVSLWYPFMWVRIRDELMDSDGRIVSEHQELLYLGMRGRVSCAYECHQVPRGIYRFGEVTIEVGEPLGLVSRRWRAGSGRDGHGGHGGRDGRGRDGRGLDRLMVIPAPLRGLAPDGLRRPGWDGAAVIAAIADATAATPLVSTVREYTHGDPLQRIHWKSSARTGGLKTKELDALDNRRVVVVLDDAAEAYGSGGAARSRFETAASAACAVVEAAAQHGLVVQLRSSSGGGAGGGGAGASGGMGGGAGRARVNAGGDSRGGSGSSHRRSGNGTAADQPIAAPPVSADAHEAPAQAARRALAQLAAAEPHGRASLAEVLREQLAGTALDAPLVLVTPHLDAPLCDCVAMLRARRYAVSLILISDTEQLDERTQQLQRQLAAQHCAVTVAVTHSTNGTSGGGHSSSDSAWPMATARNGGDGYVGA